MGYEWSLKSMFFGNFFCTFRANLLEKMAKNVDFSSAVSINCNYFFWTLAYCAETLFGPTSSIWESNRRRQNHQKIVSFQLFDCKKKFECFYDANVVSRNISTTYT